MHQKSGECETGSSSVRIRRRRKRRERETGEGRKELVKMQRGKRRMERGVVGGSEG